MTFPTSDKKQPRFWLFLLMALGTPVLFQTFSISRSITAMAVFILVLMNCKTGLRLYRHWRCVKRHRNNQITNQKPE